MYKVKIIFSLTLLLVSAFSLFFVIPTYAVGNECDTSGDLLGLDCVKGSGLSSDDPRTIATRLINVSLGLLGMIATVLIVYAGFKWMTAGGNEESVKDAQKILSASVIGLIIILSAYAISRFAITNLYQATAGTPYGAQDIN